MSLIVRSTCALVILLLATTSLPADQVKLKDGSVIIGTITGMGGGMLEITNAAADGGSVKVKFDELESITSDSDHTVVLSDGTQLRGKPMTTADGRIAVQTADAGAVTIDAAKIKSINPPPKKSSTHRGNLALNARVTDGNTRTKALGSVAEYVGRFDRSRLTIRGDWNYEETEGTISARNAAASMKYDYFFSKRLFGYVNSKFQGDDFANLNLRTTLGAGVGYQFVDAEEDDRSYSYYEELGVSFFDEDFDTAKDERYAAGRIAGSLEWKMTDTVDFFHVHEVYFGFEDQDDVYADTSTGLRAQLVGKLFATVQVNYKWDNTPAPGSRRGDTEYLLGLGWSFEY